jgi:outer membrane protein TolC
VESKASGGKVNHVRATLLIASATLAAGCAVGPRYHRPQAPADAGYAPTPLPQVSVSASIPGGEAQRLISERDIPFEWWELFKSPALNALVERAFKANPSIASAQAALVQAQELVYAQQGYFFPASARKSQVTSLSTMRPACKATATTCCHPCRT